MARFSRRKLLRTGAAAAGLFAATGVPMAANARRGGRLRVAMGGASLSDSWDARGHSGVFMIAAAQGAVFDTLTEIAADGSLKGELAESWEASADARIWTFTLRKGVTFHDGSPFGADDVIASLRLHLAPGTASPARPIVAGIAEMKRQGADKIVFTLKTGNADFPYLLSDYHLLIYPAGNIERALAEGIGTGLYRVKLFEPGKRFLGVRVDAHYKDGGAGWFDEVEFLAMNEPADRSRALMSGRVDVIDDVDPRSDAVLTRNPRTEMFEIAGNRHLALDMPALGPLADPDVRLALRYAVNREQMVATVLRGRGSVGNDTPIGPFNPYHHAGLGPAGHDPDRARYHLRKAGAETLAIRLDLPPSLLPGADGDCGAVPLDGFTLDPDAADCTLTARIWAGRPTEDWMFSAAYGPGAPWNVTGWTDPRFAALLTAGRQELDSERRREIYWEMQEIVQTRGPALIPVFAHFVGAKSRKLEHAGTIGNVHAMDNGRIAERWWMA